MNLDTPLIISVLNKGMSRTVAQYTYVPPGSNSASILKTPIAEMSDKQVDALNTEYPQVQFTGSIGIQGGAVIDDDDGVPYELQHAPYTESAAEIDVVELPDLSHHDDHADRGAYGGGTRVPDFGMWAGTSTSYVGGNEGDMSWIDDVSDSMLADDVSVDIDEHDIADIQLEQSSTSSNIQAVTTTARTSGTTPGDISPGKFRAPDVFKLPIFKIDSIETLKRKIYLTTGIPPFRQHLWIMHNGRAIQMNYRIKHEAWQTIDIRTISDIESVVEGIPVDLVWYASKESIAVQSNEHNTIGNIINKYGMIDMYLVDLATWIPDTRPIAKLIRSDSYAYDLIYWGFIIKYFPMMSQTVFRDYVTNPDNMKVQYPKLHPPRTKLTTALETEARLLNQTPPNASKLNIKSNITNSTISVHQLSIHSDDNIQLRNMFDQYPLSETVHTSICNIVVNGRRIMLLKKWGNIDIDYSHIPNNTIQYTINIPQYGTTKLQISATGGWYRIISSWWDGTEMSFQDIHDVVGKHVKPIIDQINALGSAVASRPIEPITMGNSSFTNIDMVMYLKYENTDFVKLRRHLDAFVTAGILQRVDVESHILNYYQVKGVFMHDMGKYRLNAPLTNEYAVLYDSQAAIKWFSFIIKKKHIRITRRYTDIQIEVYGLREDEYAHWRHMMLIMMAPVFNASIKGDKLTSNMVRIKHLKEMDPALFNPQKVYGTHISYSTICQSKHQPMVHSEAGEGRTQFWNYTTQQPVWYSCPNKEYSNLYFKTGVHPMDYCIPCCKKKAIVDEGGDKASKIYKECIDKHTYVVPDDRSSKSRYIKSYSYNLSPGRLARLPVETMQRLLSDHVSEDEMCDGNRLDYFMFGVPQHTAHVTQVGFMFAITSALKMTVVEFVKQTMDRIKKRGNWFILLDGSIVRYFTSEKDLVDELESAFVVGGMSSFDRWNELFMGCARYYWDVNVVIYEDNSDDENVDLIVPINVKYVSDVLTYKNTLVVMRRDQTYIPIYLTYTTTYFRNGTIDTRLFTTTHKIVGVTRDILNYKISKNRLHHPHIDFEFIKQHTNKGSKVTKLYINNINQCYGVELTRTNGKRVTIPIGFSSYRSDRYPVTFDILGPDQASKYADLLDEIKDINHTIKGISKQNQLPDGEYAYPLISEEYWVGLGDANKPIGFMSSSLLFYVADPPKHVKAGDIYHMATNPHDVNVAISRRDMVVSDMRSKTIHKSIYDKYVYQLLFLTFIDVIHTHRNKKIRDQVRQIIKSATSSSDTSRTVKLNSQMIAALKKILVDYPGDLTSVMKIVLASDASRVFDSSYFEFDKSIIDDWVKLGSRAKISKAVANLLDPHVSHDIGKLELGNEGIGNMLSSCIDRRGSDNQPYCAKAKLIIPADKYKEYVDIIAMQVINPLKRKYLTIYAFVPRSINYFNFVKRANETIYVTL